MRLHAPFRGFLLLMLFALPVAGSGWTISGPDGGTIRRLVFDPADPSIAYAGTSNGLFRSADGGQHWVAAPLLLGINIGDIAVAKSDPRIVFAASPSGLFKSSDRGASWRVLSDSGSFHLAVSAQNASVVYNVSINGLIQSANGGVTFGSRGAGLPSGTATGLVVDPQNDAVVYAAFPASAGVFKSTDSGAHWSQANSGLTAPQVFSLAVDPADGTMLYAGGGASTIFKSTDAAASWMPLATGFSGLTTTELEVSPSSPSTILAATSRGALMSTDGGALWSRGAGMADASAAEVALEPTNPATFLVALPYHLYRTGDAGATSVLSESGLTSFFTQSIATDPRNDAVVYASGPAGFARSGDHGRTWTLSTTIQPSRIAVDANSSTLYAAGGNVQRSIDGGQTWSAFNAGLPGTSPFFLAADPQLSGTLYTVVNGAVYKKVGEDAWVSRSVGLGDSIDFVTIDPHTSSTVYAGGPPGIFKSSNGAATWAPANVGLTGLNAFGVVVDPFDSRHLFAWSTQVFESVDAGANWSRRSDTNLRGPIIFDPSASGVAYANTFLGVLRSVDSGKTWYALGTVEPKSHSLFAIGAGGTPYLADSSGGVFVFQLLRQRAVGK
jgi:hypothetical protein